MNIIDELPKEFQPLIILGDINGYLHVYSFLEDETLKGLLDMAMQAIEDNAYDVKTTTLQ